MIEDDIDGDEFSELERKALRRIMLNQKRMEWLWASLRIWVGWISAAIIGAYATYEAIVNFFFKKVAP
jgi:hypothetical protein